MPKIKYDIEPTKAPTNWTPTAKDVRLYTNANKPVALCVSCAVRRRLDGAEVVLASERAASGGCADCTSQQERLL